MIKQKRLAFGISEDGVILKLANLSRDGSSITLHALEQVELDQSLYQHGTEKQADIESKLSGWDLDDNASGEINLNDLTSQEDDTYKGKPYEALFRTYSINRGIIATNVYEDQIVKLPIASSNISQKHRQKLAKDNIPKNEFKSGNWQSSVVTINEQSELWVHHGRNQLMDILEELAKSDKVKYFYQLADANDLALSNLFIANQPEDSTESSMVLYLGAEYMRALVFEGNKWTFSLPIHVTQHMPDIEVIYSKLSLALDEAHIADPNNLYLCGEIYNEDAVEFLRTQLPNSKVGIWKLPDLNIETEVAQNYDEVQIARFILPIALAWKALTLDNPKCIKSNFLPAHVIEGQKVFKIAWHGYLMLFLLFSSTLFLTHMLLSLNKEKRDESFKNIELTKEYTEKKKAAETMMTMAKAIDIQTANIEVIKTLLAGKNPWTEILTRLNSSFQSHPISWIRNLRKEAGGFKIIGVTTQRPNIVTFSNLFPNGSIIKVFHRKIRSVTVWEFEINFGYPDVNWYEMMEKDMEQLRKYQEQKTDKELKKSMTDESSKKPNDSDADKAIAFITDKTGKLKQAVSKPESKEVVVSSTSIDIPYPPKNLVENEADPMVKSYREIVKAFNSKSDWLMIDLGVKFINNYPDSALKPYVRYYLAHMHWRNKQYEKALLWLDPIIKNRDATYPYVTLLYGMIHYDNGNRDTAMQYWNAVARDYPQHSTGKTAKRLISDK
jgi:TolA-binding protein